MTEPTTIAALAGAVVLLAGIVVKLARGKIRKDRTTDRIVVAPASSKDVAEIQAGLVRLGDKIEAKHEETTMRLGVIGDEVLRLREWRHDTSNEIARMGARLVEGDRRLGALEERHPRDRRG